MKILDIEKDIPLMPAKSKINPLIHKNANRLEVGDSFVIELDRGIEEEKKLTHRGIEISLARRGKENGKVFTCKMMSEDEVRVWRVK